MAEQADLLDRYNSGAMTSGCTSNEARDGAIRNRQQPDRQAQKPTRSCPRAATGSALAVDRQRSKGVRGRQLVKGSSVHPQGCHLNSTEPGREFFGNCKH